MAKKEMKRKRREDPIVKREKWMEIGGRDWFIFKRRGSGSADCRVGSECTKP